MSRPEYTARWDMPSIYKGDTLDGFAITLTMSDGGGVIPTKVCAQIVDTLGRKVAEWEHSIDGVGRVVFSPIEGDVTSTWRAGKYSYDLEYTDFTGRVRTYLTGGFTVYEDKSKCLT